MFNVAVFVSGHGSNLRAMFEKFFGSSIKICAVVSDKKDCGAVEFALNNSIPVFFVSSTDREDFCSYSFLVEELKKIKIDLIVLAGFLKKIPDEFIFQFEKKIINIHPALLPLYGGKGMYGMNVHKAVFAARENISGATVHYVDNIYDHGEIITQRSIDIAEATSPEEIAQRVLKIEHELLPEAVLNIFESRKKIRDL